MSAFSVMYAPQSAHEGIPCHQEESPAQMAYFVLYNPNFDYTRTFFVFKFSFFVRKSKKIYCLHKFIKIKLFKERKYFTKINYFE